MKKTLLGETFPPGDDSIGVESTGEGRKMCEYILLTGSVTGEPQCFGKYTRITIRSGDKEFSVLRRPSEWQIMDVLFLRRGQTVAVEGVRKPDRPTMIVAYRIRILEFDGDEGDEEEWY